MQEPSLDATGLPCVSSSAYVNVGVVQEIDSFGF